MTPITHNRVNIFKTLLASPIAVIWDSLYRMRRNFYLYEVFSRNKFEVPIISIGNLSFGGSGKTPLTIWISKFLNEHSKKVLVLTRGYKGKIEQSFGLMKGGNYFRYDPDD